MIALNCESVSLSFGATVVLDGISFAINEGEKLGIIGVNGAGKSSLFSIITGAYEPTDGAVYIAKGHTLGLLSQNVCTESTRTILDEAYNTFSELLKDEAELERLRALAGENANAQSDNGDKGED